MIDWERRVNEDKAFDCEAKFSQLVEGFERYYASEGPA